MAANRRSKFDRIIEKLNENNSEILDETIKIREGIDKISTVESNNTESDSPIPIPAEDKQNKPKPSVPSTPNGQNSEDSLESKLDYLASLSSMSIGAQRDGIRDIGKVIEEIQNSQDLSKEEKNDLIAKLEEQREVLKEQTSVFRGLGDKMIDGFDKVGGSLSFALGGSPLIAIMSSFVSGQVKEFLARRKERKEERKARELALKQTSTLDKIRFLISKRKPQTNELTPKKIKRSNQGFGGKGLFGFLMIGFAGVFGYLLKTFIGVKKVVGVVFEKLGGAILKLKNSLVFIADKFKWMWGVLKKGLVKLLSSLGLSGLLSTDKSSKKGPKGQTATPKETKGKDSKKGPKTTKRGSKVPSKTKVLTKGSKKGVESLAKRAIAVKLAMKAGLRFVPFLGWAYTAADLAALAFTGGQKDLFDLAGQMIPENNQDSGKIARNTRGARKAKSAEKIQALKVSTKEFKDVTDPNRKEVSTNQSINSSNLNAQQNITNVLAARLNPRNDERSFRDAVTVSGI